MTLGWYYEGLGREMSFPMLKYDLLQGLPNIMDASSKLDANCIPISDVLRARDILYEKGGVIKTPLLPLNVDVADKKVCYIHSCIVIYILFFCSL